MAAHRAADRSHQMSGAPVWAAALDYWRLPARDWRSRLAALRSAGLTHLEAAVPWRVHQPAGGTPSWSGSLDLARLIREAGESGLGVVLRIDPVLDCDLPNFGLPDDVVADPACQARTNAKTPVWMPSPPRAWPVPSLASPAFQARVRAWFEHVIAAVRPLIAPGGPIAAVMSDDPAPLFFRSADHAAAGVAALAAAEHQWSDGLQTFAAMRDQLGLGELRHIDGGPLAVSRGRVAFRDLRRIAGWSRAPIARATIGAIPWWPPHDRGDDVTRERDQVLSLLAGGARGLALRPVGTARDTDWVGRAAGWLKPLLAAADHCHARQRAPIALIEPRVDERFAIATSVIAPMSTWALRAMRLDPLALADDTAASAVARWLAVIGDSCELAQVACDRLGEDATPDELARYRAVIVPIIDRVDRRLWRTLNTVARDHKRVRIVIGPGTPSRDELDQPLADPVPPRLGRLQPESLDDASGLIEDLAALAARTTAWSIGDPARLIVVRGDDDQPRALFIVNDTAAVTTTTVEPPPAIELFDPFTGDPLDDKQPNRVTVGAHSLRMFARRC